MRQKKGAQRCARRAKMRGAKMRSSKKFMRDDAQAKRRAARQDAQRARGAAQTREASDAAARGGAKDTVPRDMRRCRHVSQHAKRIVRVRARMQNVSSPEKRQEERCARQNDPSQPPPPPTSKTTVPSPVQKVHSQRKEAREKARVPLPSRRV